MLLMITKMKHELPDALRVKVLVLSGNQKSSASNTSGKTNSTYPLSINDLLEENADVVRERQEKLQMLSLVKEAIRVIEHDTHVS